MLNPEQVGICTHCHKVASRITGSIMQEHTEIQQCLRAKTLEQYVYEWTEEKLMEQRRYYDEIEPVKRMV